MKKFIFAAFAILVSTTTLFAQAQNDTSKIVKEDVLYAIKGTDTLYLTKYECPEAQDTITGPRPVVILVFGGGFFMGSRNMDYFQDYVHHVAESGYTFFTIDYRLGLKKYYDEMDQIKKQTGKAPKNSFADFVDALHKSVDMAVEDLFSATAFIVEHAQEWNIDPSLIVVSGSSAGAITSLQSQFYICNWRKDGKTQPWDHLVEILPANFNYAGVISYAGAILNLDGRLGWNTQPAPIALFHGDIDPTVPYKQIGVPFVGKMNGSVNVAKSLDKAGAPYLFCTYNKQNHSVAAVPMNTDFELLDYFLNKWVKEKKQYVVNASINDLSLPNKSKSEARREAKKENEAYQSGEHSYGREKSEDKK